MLVLEIQYLIVETPPGRILEKRKSNISKYIISESILAAEKREKINFW